jgi:hypothetical protein
VPTDTAGKPDLHPMGMIHDQRVYQCQSCGDRYTNEEVDSMGGLCPKDGAILRPLGQYEQAHKDLWRSWWTRKSA